MYRIMTFYCLLQLYIVNNHISVKMFFTTIKLTYVTTKNNNNNNNKR